MRPSTSTPARRLAEAIERAFRLGLAGQADRLACHAARMMMHSPRLTECIARLRLAQGNAETALSIVEGSRFRTDSMRLLRAFCLVELGRMIEAEMDLVGWTREANVPPEARRLLAMIAPAPSAFPGTSARSVLVQNVIEDEDPASIELLLIDALANNQHELAAHLARRLVSSSRYHSSTVDPDLLLQSLGVVAEVDGMQRPADGEIEILAMEIGASEDVLPALVRAQQMAFDPQCTRLLRDATERALPELTDRAMACEALARLSLFLEERDEAMRWVQRGLEINPMSATLAMLAGEIWVGADASSQGDERAEERRAA